MFTDGGVRRDMVNHALQRPIAGKGVGFELDDNL